MYERYKLLQKSNDNNILNCNYDHFFFIKEYYYIRRYSIFLFIFKSGFTPCADIVNQISARQVVGIRVTTLIRHESEKNAQSWMTGRRGNSLLCRRSD